MTPKVMWGGDKWGGNSAGTTGATPGIRTVYDDYGGGVYLSSCKHWRSPIEIKGVSGKLFASGHLNSPRGSALDWLPYPDMGVYLNTFWFEDLGGIGATGMQLDIVPLWPFVTVAWPDYGAVSQSYYKLLVGTVVDALREGKTVEVACAAGHGRTGTLVAGVMAVVEQLKAKDALKELRARYCFSAVESHKQEVMLYELLGEKPPAAPVYSTGPVCADCGHTDTMHGKTMQSDDYKTGACVRQACGCQHFVAPKKAPGALKPCLCGHSKNKHRGHLKMCVQCGSCDGYEAAAATVSTSKCGCGHLDISHGNRGTGTYLHGVCVVTGCKCKEFDKLVPTGAPKQLPSVASGGNNSYQYPIPYTPQIVCLCGHLRSTHTYGNQNECKLCVCSKFDDADNYPDADATAYTLPLRHRAAGTSRIPGSPTFEEWKKNNVVEGEVVKLATDQDVENLVRVLLETTGDSEETYE